MTDVLAGGAAQAAGLIPGDRILSINAQPVGDVRQQLSGDTARLELARGPGVGGRRLEVTLSRRPTLNLA
ncbi:PDZ domain-containing protein, partial [Escherichia coli]|nr:PDZ domain-containing protein [Escherichia coli]